MLRFAVLGDPQRATFAVMHPLSEGSGDQAESIFAWDELHATDADAAAGFYTGLLGWTTADFAEGYRTFNSGETMVGGLMQDGNAYWLPYLRVDDADAATAKAQELGATVVMGPETMENVGRFSVVADPTGAAVGLHASAN